MGEASEEPLRLSASEFRELGLPDGPERGLALASVRALVAAGTPRDDVLAYLRSVIEDPVEHADDVMFGDLARALAEKSGPSFQERDAPAPWRQWGHDLEPQSVQQMEQACRLPVAVRGALMPDAHLGYGLPIGGVLATRNAVIPYAVGVDIACRVKLSVLDMPISALDREQDRLKQSIEQETRFGIGAAFRRRRHHDVMDRDWKVTETTRRVRDKAWAQLGTSGSGNHFVEFGVFSCPDQRAGLEPGDYLALLSHSGSRGAGATVAGHYSRLAMDLHPELPRELRHLAWLDLDSEAGQEYWAAMELMGAYAAANHWCIHHHIAEHLGVEVLLDVENHHNFAWKEVHGGEELVVHRKGATPAGEGALGVVPGTMADPAYLIRGRGSAASLRSASHGAGRVMSRTRAKKTLDWSEARRYLDERGVTLLSAGLDEVPMVYKDIDQVMASQEDLVEVLASFAPRLVKMAPGSERPED